MLDQLSQLGLSGMAQAFAELEASDETVTLTHADWLGLLLDRELTHRRDKRLAARLRYARLRQQASVEDADYRHCLLLRRQGASRGHRAAQKQHQLAPPHSMTSSARARIASGMVSPRVLAVLRLMTSLNVVGCCTGRSPGLAPFKIFAT